MGKANQAKDQAMDLAEAAREEQWKAPSFTASLFRGGFAWPLLHPFPEQDAADRAAGDALIEKLRAVFDAHLDPIAVDATGEYPPEALEKLAEIGIFGMKIPREYGGLGLSQTNYARVLSFMGSYCQSTATWVSAHQSIGVPQPLKLFGTEEQKKKYLPRLAKGGISAFALTEPDVGSDPAKMSTTAEPSEDGTHYLLNGRKLWTTNGPDADLIVVMARTPSIMKHGKERPQITAFIVEMNTPGVEVLHHCRFMGLNGLSNGELQFKDVRVPAENIIGETGQGLKIALTTLNTGRLGIPAASTGACKKLLLECERWINERVQWGVPIGKHQAVAEKTATMAANTFAMESLVRVCCAFADNESADIRLEAAAAKYFCTEMSWKFMDDFMQVRGGRGYEKELSLYGRGERPVPGERLMRDNRIGRIFEGSSEVMHLIMAREALDTHFRLIMPIIKPRPGQKEGLVALLWKAFRFYAAWYPKTWFPVFVDYNVQHLNHQNQAHLAYCAKTARRLARSLFHTMARLGPKLETEQLLLGNHVEVGVDLFVMGAVLANAEHLSKQRPADPTPQELADLFCKEARGRIAANLKATKRNHNHQYGKVSRTLMAGKYRWLASDVYEDVPPKYRDYVTR